MNINYETPMSQKKLEDDMSSVVDAVEICILGYFVLML